MARTDQIRMKRQTCMNFMHFMNLYGFVSNQAISKKPVSKLSQIFLLGFSAKIQFVVSHPKLIKVKILSLPLRNSLVTVCCHITACLMINYFKIVLMILTIIFSDIENRVGI